MAFKFIRLSKRFYLMSKHGVGRGHKRLPCKLLNRSIRSRFNLYKKKSRLFTFWTWLTFSSFWAKNANVSHKYLFKCLPSVQQRFIVMGHLVFNWIVLVRSIKAHRAEHSWSFPSKLRFVCLVWFSLLIYDYNIM